MMRSMFSGVSGLRNHQLRMDVIGNNIANVNTIGYKRARVTFQDMLSQNIRGASSPQGGKGGTNPQQIGLGMTVNSIDILHTQGSSETTGKVTDMMVDGDGFFMVGDGNNTFYTRAGNFDFDSAGNLISPSGLMVKGWMADDSSGDIDTTGAISGIQIPKGQAIQPQETQNISLVGNLDANAVTYDDTVTPPTGTTVPVSLTVYDSLGNSWPLTLHLDKDSASGQWLVTRIDNPGWTTAPSVSGGPIIFDSTGKLTAAGDGPLVITGAPPNANAFVAGTNPITVDISSLTGYASDSGESNVELNSQDGYSSGVLNGYSIDKTGIVTGRFSNGLTKQLAQVTLANFNNPAGLMKVGENNYVSSNNSGQAQIGTAGSGGRGDISPGKIEMSNVDLSQEFTDMIVTQRGFQANSRIITVSDEMLQELVNLKR
ncbi:flagellar hook protein FlgE [Phosphitispora fastidiosa]|uniref:flagellar hook protein FlgE n=1 Tax=Phosphitispora fastidiosa TaxID=2837202 RepID=UPI001E555D8A|nr:flagellar hook protein FlgE [Phosphitispora fastidiosa]MBU7008273.1 flagellar hook protein FlgE [Phosphitispora fastidiosa]